jgi:hypothetical protein
MTNLNRSGFLFLCCTVLCVPDVTCAQAAPANDNFVDAAVITGDTGTTDGSNVAATAEAGEPDYVNVTSPQAACRSVWYQWTAPADGEYYFNTFGSDFDTILAVYTGTVVNSLTPVNDNDDYVDVGPPVVSREQSRLSFPATAGTTYHLAVDGWECAQGNIVMNWGPASLLPANDNFVSAAGISGSTGTLTGTNINATPEDLEPIHHANNDAPYSSIWFEWTAPADDNFIFDSFGSDFDTILAVYEGPAFGSLTQLATNDDTGTGFQSRVVFTATGSQTYRIVVDGYQGLQGNATLNWQNGPVLPPNDAFNNATTLSGQTGTTSAYNFLATPEPGEPPHGAASGPFASIWFAWTAPFSGKAAFDTFGSDFDTTMAAYTGTAVDSLTKLQENDDTGTGFQSRITFPVVAGSTYYIAVDGFDGADGNVVLSWKRQSSWILFLPAISGTAGQSGNFLFPATRIHPLQAGNQSGGKIVDE